MKYAGFKRVEDLQAAVDKLTLSIQRARAKILGTEPPPLESEVSSLFKGHHRSQSLGPLPQPSDHHVICTNFVSFRVQ